MKIFMYLDVDSFLHRLDPRVKLIILLFFMTVALMYVNPFIQLGLLATAMVYASFGKCWRNIRSMKFVYLSVLIVSIIVWSLTIRQGSHIFLFVYTGGIIKGSSAGLTLGSIITASLAFVSTTKPEELSASLIKMKVSYRGAFALTTAIRMIPTIVGTGYTILQAQKSRGLDVESGTVIARLKKYIPLMAPAIISVIRGANVFSMALESKGFGYSDTRTQYMQVKYTASDYALTAVMAILFAAVIYVRYILNISLNML